MFVLVKFIFCWGRCVNENKLLYVLGSERGYGENKVGLREFRVGFIL